MLFSFNKFKINIFLLQNDEIASLLSLGSFENKKLVFSHFTFFLKLFQGQTFSIQILLKFKSIQSIIFLLVSSGFLL